MFARGRFALVWLEFGAAECWLPGGRAALTRSDAGLWRGGIDVAACLPGCLDHLQCLRPGYLVCSRGHTAHRCALTESPPREFIVFSMLEVTDKRRLRARAPASRAQPIAWPHAGPRVLAIGRSFAPPLASDLYRPALLPPIGGSSSAETLTELPRSSGQGHAPSRSSQPSHSPYTSVVSPSAFFVRLSLTLPASSRPLFCLARTSSFCLCFQQRLRSSARLLVPFHPSISMSLFLIHVNYVVLERLVPSSI